MADSQLMNGCLRMSTTNITILFWVSIKYKMDVEWLLGDESNSELHG